MKNYIKIACLLSVTVLVFTACSSKKSDKGLESKKQELEKLKSDADILSQKIKALEEEITSLDSSALSTGALKLVAVEELQVKNFTHYIDLQAKIDAEDISYIAPRGMGGLVKSLLIKKGDFIKKGQLVATLDDGVIKQNVKAAEQNLEVLKVQLEFARNIYQRQRNLWNEGIGTEVQLLQAKNNVETLEKNLLSAQEQVKVAEEQLKTTKVYSDVEGIADEVNVRVGETFTGIGALGAQIKIVNTSKLKVVADVPENYLSKVKVGVPVVVNLPDLNKEIKSTIKIAGRSINPNTRAFTAEASIPYDASILPNQVANLKIQDYVNNNAITIPVNVVQTDEKGKYVFIAENKNGKIIASKKMITVGELYGTYIEVKTGLTAGQKVITEGFQDLYDGQIVDIK
jgi:RND family efflux transporter MFP subunit